ncbi:3-ketodihydrosphingosine reductase domain protein, partial [Oesophagostomum dentatum]
AACEELQTAADQRGQQQKVRWYSLDLTKGYDEVEAVIRKAEKELGPVDVLINNAGTSVQAPFHVQPITDFESQMRVNYLSAVYATRCVAAGMMSRRSGHISFVSSAAGQCAIYGYTAYAPTKFALRGFADALQMELFPYKINVSVLYPPNTDTEGFKVESATMPEETELISAAAGLFSPEEV